MQSAIYYQPLESQQILNHGGLCFSGETDRQISQESCLSAEAYSVASVIAMDTGDYLVICSLWLLTHRPYFNFT